MTSKFEQLIEYVINDEEAKAKELFHDIVVEKSREIYENLMDESAEEELEEAESTDKKTKKLKKPAKKSPKTSSTTTKKIVKNAWTRKKTKKWTSPCKA
jgi:hypothetical protein